MSQHHCYCFVLGSLTAIHWKADGKRKRAIEKSVNLFMFRKIFSIRVSFYINYVFLLSPRQILLLIISIYFFIVYLELVFEETLNWPSIWEALYSNQFDVVEAKLESDQLLSLAIEKKHQENSYYSYNFRFLFTAASEAPSIYAANSSLRARMEGCQFVCVRTQ